MVVGVVFVIVVVVLVERFRGKTILLVAMIARSKEQVGAIDVWRHEGFGQDCPRV